MILLSVFPISAYADPQCPSSQEGYLPLIKPLPIDKDGGMPGDGFKNQRLTEYTHITSNSDGTIKFQYFVPTTHTSDLKLHVIWDIIKTCETTWMGSKTNLNLPLDTGVITLNVAPNKDYRIEFYPESRDNDYSDGYVSAWQGIVKFYGSNYSPNPTPNPIDSDGDGFVDRVDGCPTIPGVAPNGCQNNPPGSPLPSIIQDNWSLITTAGPILGIIASIVAISVHLKNAAKK